MPDPQPPDLRDDSRIAELLHATLHAAAGPNGQIHRIAALLLNQGLEGNADSRLWLSHLSTATQKLDECLIAVRRYTQVFDLPRERRRLALGEAVAGLRQRCPVIVGKLPEVAADPARLQLVFDELLSNGCKFGGREVRVSAEASGGEVEVSVADNGIGIEPEQWERIFRPFVQLAGDRYAGAGMGLTIARALVEGWGGRIWVESTVGKGSVFRFTIPRGL